MSESTVTPNPTPEVATPNQYDLLMNINSLVEVGFKAASNGEVDDKHFENLLIIYQSLYRDYCLTIDFNV